MTTKSVRWNGDKEDPDTIVQSGITFPKGEWVDVEHDEAKPDQVARMKKFEGNPTFEVQGEDLIEDPKAPATKAAAKAKA